MSLSDWTRLVSMSARKNCLNCTRPKGEIKIFKKVFHMRIKSVLKRQWKGLRHMIVTKQSAAKVKAATAFPKII
jgi:hypothetical protein